MGGRVLFITIGHVMIEYQIIKATSAMREAQKEYSRTHNMDVLDKSLKLEKEVDRLIEDYFRSKQLSLF